jgi:hypothetical protein
MGLKGDLTAGEIVEQLVHAQRVTTIKNVVFMVSNPPIPCHHHSASLSPLPQTLHAVVILRCKGQKAWLRGVESTMLLLACVACILNSTESCVVCRAWESR